MEYFNSRYQIYSKLSQLYKLTYVQVKITV